MGQACSPFKRKTVVIIALFCLSAAASWGCAGGDTAPPAFTPTPTQTSPQSVPTPTVEAPVKEDHYTITGVEKICQLVGDYDRERDQPTINLTGEKWNLPRTDLGVPFRHQGLTYLLFGDAWDPPDDPIAYTADDDPEDCLELTFLTRENGNYLPLQIPEVSLGAFEVPMEGISLEGKIYLYATTDHSKDLIMGRSVLAVSDNDGQTFSYLYDFSAEKFLNVSIVEEQPTPDSGYPVSAGSGLVIFGSGSYRESDLYLAFQPADQIEDPGSILYFSGMDADSNPVWSQSEHDADPLFSQPCLGEFSATYNPFLQKWVLLYNCQIEPYRGIILRLADQPWGPWSEPQILFHPWQDGGYCHFIHTSWEHDECDQVNDPGRENEWGGEYGPYQFENFARGEAGSTTIYFTLSTWNPYTVVLMKATISLD